MPCQKDSIQCTKAYQNTLNNPEGCCVEKKKRRDLLSVLLLGYFFSPLIFFLRNQVCESFNVISNNKIYFYFINPFKHN